MGSADIIPGVSGGTIALITGIYQRLIEAISSVFALINTGNIKNLIKLRFREVWKTFCAIDFALIVPLGIGILSAFFALSNVIHFLMEDYTAITYAFFFGLILASAYFLYRKIEGFRKSTYVSVILGFIAGFIIVGLETLKASHSAPVIFFSGSIAITAMILPGISGAFILLLLNQYEHVVNIIRTLDFKGIATFGAGAFVGLMLFSKLLNYLLHNHKRKTMGFLIGLMLGSMRLQLMIINREVLGNAEKIFVGLAVLAGFAVVYLLTRMKK